MDPVKSVTSLDATKKAFSLLEEFKSFALKGNVIDLAIGVIIGGAFGKIVDSLVKSVIMPLIGIIMPGTDDLKASFWEFSGQKIEYGAFLAEVINFVIVAVALFIFIKKFLGWAMRTRRQPAAPVKLTKDQELLTEIRDLMAGRKPT